MLFQKLKERLFCHVFSEKEPFELSSFVVVVVIIVSLLIQLNPQA